MSKLIKINDSTSRDIKRIASVEKERQRLHLPAVPIMFYKIDIYSPQGEHTLEYKFRSKSWNRNFYNYTACLQMGLASNTGGTTFEAGKMPMKDTGNITKQTSFIFIPRDSTYNAGDPTAFYGGAGIDTQGIVVGTGNIAESFEHYALNAKCANGNGAGQLSYTSESVGAMTYDAPTKKLTTTLIRIFNNNSGASIIITEVGWYIKLFVSAYNFFMLSRDLLASSVEVLNAGQLTVTQTIELTYPA